MLYAGMNSRSCAQTVYLRNWGTGWMTLDSRTVGTTLVDIEATVGGTLSRFVSGAAGPGEVRVRVRCTNPTPAGRFFASGDMLNLQYGTP
ncbi:MAG TPA: hypothetical protein VG602_06475 [Actinomycetota bacterium]|nr:hypothetical protein [Actinomycetota bacterium]